MQVIYSQTKEDDSCPSIKKKVSNEDSNQVKYKKISVGVPIIPPSNSMQKLRRKNEKITRSLNLPLADSGLSNAEKDYMLQIKESVKNLNTMKMEYWIYFLDDAIND